MARNRIVWLLEQDAGEEGGDYHVYSTRGWLEDGEMLRFSLSRALTTEGTHNGWRSAMDAAESAEIEWASGGEQAVTIAHVPIEER